ncbi:hypothetical protein U0070_013467, partial [Myodes glareolus]
SSSGVGDDTDGGPRWSTELSPPRSKRGAKGEENDEGLRGILSPTDTRGSQDITHTDFEFTAIPHSAENELLYSWEMCIPNNSYGVGPLLAELHFENLVPHLTSGRTPHLMALLVSLPVKNQTMAWILFQQHVCNLIDGIHLTITQGKHIPGQGLVALASLYGRGKNLQITVPDNSPSARTGKESRGRKRSRKTKREWRTAAAFFKGRDHAPMG